MRRTLSLILCFACGHLFAGRPQAINIQVIDTDSGFHDDGWGQDERPGLSFRVTGVYDGSVVKDLKIRNVAWPDSYPGYFVDGGHLNAAFRWVFDTKGAIWIKSIHVTPQLLSDIVHVRPYFFTNSNPNGMSGRQTVRFVNSGPFTLVFSQKGLGHAVLESSSQQVKFKTTMSWAHYTVAAHEIVRRTYILRYVQSQVSTYPFPPPEE